MLHDTITLLCAAKVDATLLYARLILDAVNDLQAPVKPKEWRAAEDRLGGLLAMIDDTDWSYADEDARIYCGALSSYFGCRGITLARIAPESVVSLMREIGDRLWTIAYNDAPEESDSTGLCFVPMVGRA